MCTHRDLPARLLLSILDYAMVDDQRISRRAIRGNTHIPSDALAEFGIRIAQEQDLAFDSIDFTPRAHDKGIVGSNDGDHIDPFFFNAVQVLDVPREVAFGTAWSEGARNGDEDDFLVGKFIAGFVSYWYATSSGAVSFGTPGYVSMMVCWLATCLDG